VYQELGRPDRAEPFAAEAVRLARARTPDQLADSLTLLGDCQMAGRKAADAEKTFRELLAMREKEGPKLLVTADVRARLAEALTAQKKFAEAEPLLLAAFDTFLGRKRAFEARPGVERDVMIRRWVEIHSLIGRLYAEWGKPGEVARWRKRRSELPPEPAPPPREVKK
jgi:tetratricopeptide (TPR) repeat protein